MTIVVTGEAGFIGSDFAIDRLEAIGEPVVNLDKLTYAGNLASLTNVPHETRHRFVHGGAEDASFVERLLSEHRPSAAFSCAAESHVDRSVRGAEDSLRAHVEGTFCPKKSRHHITPFLAARREGTSTRPSMQSRWSGNWASGPPKCSSPAAARR